MFVSTSEKRPLLCWSLIVLILACQNSITLCVSTHVPVEVRLKCDVKDSQCPIQVENLKQKISHHLKDTVRVIVDKTAAVSGEILSAIHFDGSQDGIKFDLSSGWVSFKRAFENMLVKQHKSSKLSTSINSIEEYSNILANIGTKSFFVVTTSNSKRIEKFAQFAKANFDTSAIVLHLKCDTDQSKLLCNLLSLDYSQIGDKNFFSFALMNSNFANRKHETLKESSDDAFEKFLSNFFNSNKKTYSGSLLMYFAPWCGHCKVAKPKFEEAAELIKKDFPGFVVDKIDCTTDQDTCSKAGIQGFPTFKVNGGEYYGQRKVSDFYDAAKKAATPSNSFKESPIVQIMTPGQIASYLDNSLNGNKLLILTLNKRMAPSEALSLIKTVADAASTQNSKFTAAFAITGINPVFDKYLGVNENYHANLVLLSEGAIKNSIGNLNSGLITEIISNNDFGKFAAKIRDPIVLFSPLKVYLPFSTSYVEKIDQLTAKLSTINPKIAKLNTNDRVAYLVNDEQVFESKIFNFANYDAVIDEFKSFLENMDQSSAKQDL